MDDGDDEQREDEDEEAEKISGSFVASDVPSSQLRKPATSLQPVPGGVAGRAGRERRATTARQARSAAGRLRSSGLGGPQPAGMPPAAPPDGPPGPAAGGREAAARAARALGYPYPRPAGSFLFRPGRPHLGFPCGRWRGLAGLPALAAQLGAGLGAGALAGCEAWTPVLAIGSNASPEQLERKFPGAEFGGKVVPCVKGHLRGFDVVFAPLISSYGSVTATLEVADPATSVEVFVTFLEESLLERMHATEGAYDLTLLEEVHLELGNGEVLERIAQYNHQAGTLHVPGPSGAASAAGPVALAEIPATGRTFPALGQREMQELVHSFLGVDGEFGTPYLLENLDDAEVRKARVEALLAAARPFQYNKATVQRTLGTVFDASVK